MNDKNVTYNNEGQQFAALNDLYHQAKDLLKEEQYAASKAIIQKAYPIILSGKPKWNQNLKRELTRELSQLIMSLLESDEDIEHFYDCIVKEIQIYESFLQQTDNICSNMDLAIALSHMAMYFQQTGDHKRATLSELKKLEYNDTALEKSHAGEPSFGYDLEMIETSAFNSVCRIIESSNQLSDDDRLASHEECLWTLMKVIMLNRETAIDFYGLSNSIAEELFCSYKAVAPERACRFMLCKISNLTYLATTYGAEEGILNDIKITYNLCSDFFEEQKESMSAEEYSLWQQFSEIKSSLM